MPQFHLNYQSFVSSSLSDVWRWITSLKGISSEMWPYFRMTAPRNVKSIEDIDIELGKRLFRSKIYLFGFLPFGYDDMTLVQFTPGKGFIEQSLITSMKLWRHQRDISETEGGTLITDQLTFEPIHAARLIGWFMNRVFQHRHKVLMRNLNRSNSF